MADGNDSDIIAVQFASSGTVSAGATAAGAFPSALPGDNADALNLYIGSTANGDDARDGDITVEVYVTARKPKTAAEARNGSQILAPLVLPAVPTLMSAGAFSYNLVVNIPLVFRLGQSSRYVTVLITAGNVDIRYAAFMKVFRG